VLYSLLTIHLWFSYPSCDNSVFGPAKKAITTACCLLSYGMCFCGDKAQCMTENLQGVSECVNLHVIVSNWWYLTGKCVSWLIVQIRQSKHMPGAPSFVVKLQGDARSCKIKSNRLVFGSPRRENLESGWCPCVVCWGVYCLLFPKYELPAPKWCPDTFSVRSISHAEFYLQIKFSKTVPGGLGLESVKTQNFSCLHIILSGRPVLVLLEWAVYTLPSKQEVESDVAPAKFLTSVFRYQAMRCIDRLRLGEELNCIHNGGLCDRISVHL
jgi:hypothetical protein